MSEPYNARKTKGWAEASMHIFIRCKKPSRGSFKGKIGPALSRASGHTIIPTPAIP